MNIITSNQIDIKSIKDYNDNWVISHLVITHGLAPLAKPTMGYHFKVYYKDGYDTDLTEYKNESIFRFRYDFIPVRSIPDALDMIGEDIRKQESPEYNEYDNSAADDNEPEEIIVWAACNIKWNSQVVKAINAKLQNTFATDLYKYLGVVSMDRVVESLKSALNTQFIYPDDPIAFGYALSQILQGMV